MARIILHVHRPRPTRDDGARWEESKHPRADDGKFGSGAGTAVAPGVKVHVHDPKAETAKASTSPTVVKRAADFSETGEYDVTVGGQTGKMYRNTSSGGQAIAGGWYRADKDNRDGSPISLGYNREDATARMEAILRAEAATKAKPAGAEFNAHDYAKSQDDPDATAGKIMAKLTPEQRAEVEEVHRKIATAGQTIDRHRDAVGNYAQDRKAIHNAILFEGREGLDPENPGKTKWYPGILNPDQIGAATPPPGEKPTFTILGGRGGSGKSAFKGDVYHEDNAIVLDADVIKHMIEEFQGWNANEVHEESSDILETAISTARELGLNVVLDATMKSSGGAMEKVQGFKDAGYRVEAHYMHLPRHIAAERAVGRYFSPGNKVEGARGRYVPAHVVLGNRLNEANFDQVRQHADKWSFSDNNVPRGQKPRLIARGGYDD